MFVIGPAGSGKTTLCSQLRDYHASRNRNCALVNLDPAQALEDTEYAVDIRDHIDVQEVLEQTDFGPNGALMLAMQAIAENEDVLGIPEEESFLIFDCPGQIELYAHSDSVLKILQSVHKYHRVVVAYALDATHVSTVQKFIAGSLVAAISMAKFEVPHLSILTKCDLLGEDANPEEFLSMLSFEQLVAEAPRIGGKEKRYLESLAKIIEDNGLLEFRPLDYAREETLEDIALAIDTLTQYLEEA